MYIKNAAALLVAAVLALAGTLTVFAEPSEPSAPVSQAAQESVIPGESSAGESAEAYEPSTEVSMQSSVESSYESSTEETHSSEESTTDESAQESSGEESGSESSTESSLESGEASDSSNAAGQVSEVSRIKVTDPFGKLNDLDYILPADAPDFEVKRQKYESSLLAAAEIRSANSLIQSPPLPISDDNDELSFVKEEEDASFMMGVVIWSVIGVVIAVLLILMLNLKGGGDFSMGRKRYYKKTYRPTRNAHKKYRYTGR